jgi:hypothetical protein
MNLCAVYLFYSARGRREAFAGAIFKGNLRLRISLRRGTAVDYLVLNEQGECIEGLRLRDSLGR